MCYGMGCPYETQPEGECGWHGRGPYPCNDWPEEEQEDSCPEDALEEEE